MWMPNSFVPLEIFILLEEKADVNSHFYSALKFIKHIFLFCTNNQKNMEKGVSVWSL